MVSARLKEEINGKRLRKKHRKSGKKFIKICLNTIHISQHIKQHATAI